MNKIGRLDLFKTISSPLGKRIDQNAVESWAASFWALAKPKKPASEERFAMMLPPPNITGNLHLGHALTAAVQDALIRQRRMLGQTAIWIPGFDHAGLATQNIVEKIIWNRDRVTRVELGREKFLEIANEWKQSKLSQMKDQLERLGLELNYEREYFTMDDKSSMTVQAAFKRLFESGVIYRAVRPVFWSEQLKTTLSDIEVEKVNGVDRYNRTGEVVYKKPISQWFVRTQDMTRQAIEVVENNSISIVPSNYRNSWARRLLHNDAQDWCISRQSWWGHRIPAYKLKSSEDRRENWIVADSLEAAQKLLGDPENVEQDPDVLDTWFSSSLLPLTVSGWPDESEFSESSANGSFPLDVMETGFDILTFWVSKMVMMSIALEKTIPFKTIVLHGMICDSDGKKMSKSKGNVIDPLDVIDGTSLKQLQEHTRKMRSEGLVEEKEMNLALDLQKRLFPNGIPCCGADGLRAYLLSHDIQEEVVKIQMMQLDRVRKFTNKIWNIYRFVITLTDQESADTNEQFKPNLDMKIEELIKLKLDSDDQQVLAAMYQCVVAARRSFHESYQLQHTFNQLELFITQHLSAGYLPKVRQTALNKEATRELKSRKVQLMVTCLITSTKLLHPFMPHLTEFLYQKLRSFYSSMDDRNFLEETRLGDESYPRVEEWGQSFDSGE